MKTTFNISITIYCDPDNTSGFENSLDEAVKSIKLGCKEGIAGNDEAEYFFDVSKRPDEEEGI